MLDPMSVPLAGGGAACVGPAEGGHRDPVGMGHTPSHSVFGGAMGSPLALSPRIASPLHAGSRAV